MVQQSKSIVMHRSSDVFCTMYSFTSSPSWISSLIQSVTDGRTESSRSNQTKRENARSFLAVLNSLSLVERREEKRREKRERETERTTLTLFTKSALTIACMGVSQETLQKQDTVNKFL